MDVLRADYLVVRLRVLLTSLAPGVWVISTWITCLQASLSSELRSLRQIAMSSAFGMNALQSLNASGVHAARCSGVPCENEGADQAVASSRHRDIPRARDLDRRCVRLFELFVFIGSLALINRGRYSISSSRHRYALAGARACRKTSAFVAFDPAAADRVLERPCGGVSNMELLGSGRSVSTAGAHEPPSHHRFVQASCLM
jgi:hypothetical protein